jgi:hypothetical protein
MKKTKNSITDKRRRKSMQKYLDGGGESNYAKKRKYCVKHAVWGFDVQEPKPWKGKN